MALNPRQARPLTDPLFGNTKRDRSFPPPSVCRQSKNTNYPNVGRDPMLLLGWVVKAKPNPNYPNPRLWLVRRRNKMNIWLKCYSVKRQRRSSVDDLINVPHYVFCRYLLISFCFCPSSLCDSFYLLHRWAWELNVVQYFFLITWPLRSRNYGENQHNLFHSK